MNVLAEGHPITPGNVGENLTLDSQVGRVSQEHHPGDSGVYARVLREGVLWSGDRARIVSANEMRALITVR